MIPHTQHSAVGRYCAALLALVTFAQRGAWSQHHDDHKHAHPASTSPVSVQPDADVDSGEASEYLSIDGLRGIVLSRNLERFPPPPAVAPMLDQCVQALVVGDSDTAVDIWRRVNLEYNDYEQFRWDTCLNSVLYRAFIAPDDELRRRAAIVDFYFRQWNAAYSHNSLLEKQYSANHGNPTADIRIHPQVLNEYAQDNDPVTEAPAERVAVEDLPQRIAEWRDQLRTVSEDELAACRALKDAIERRPELHAAMASAAGRLEAVVRRIQFRSEFGFEKGTTPLLTRNELKELAMYVPVKYAKYDAFNGEAVIEGRFGDALTQWREIIEEALAENSTQFDLDLYVASTLMWEFFRGWDQQLANDGWPLAELVRYYAEQEAALGDFIAGLREAAASASPGQAVLVEPLVLIPRVRRYRDALRYDPAVTVPAENLESYIQDAESELQRVRAEGEDALDTYQEFMLENRDEYELMSVFARALRETANEVIQVRAKSVHDAPAP